MQAKIDAKSFVDALLMQGKRHLVFDFDGTFIANHTFYNSVLKERFGGYPCVNPDDVNLTQEEARALVPDFEFSEALLKECYDRGVSFGFASKQSAEGMIGFFARAGLNVKHVTGGFHGKACNGAIDKTEVFEYKDGIGWVSNGLVDSRDGGEKENYVDKEYVEKGLGGEVVYCDDAEGKKLQDRQKEGRLPGAVVFGGGEEIMPLDSSNTYLYDGIKPVERGAFGSDQAFILAQGRLGADVSVWWDLREKLSMALDDDVFYSLVAELENSGYELGQDILAEFSVIDQRKTALQQQRERSDSIDRDLEDAKSLVSLFKGRLGSKIEEYPAFNEEGFARQIAGSSRKDWLDKKSRRESTSGLLDRFSKGRKNLFGSRQKGDSLREFFEDELRLFEERKAERTTPVQGVEVTFEPHYDTLEVAGVGVRESSTDTNSLSKEVSVEPVFGERIYDDNYRGNSPDVTEPLYMNLIGGGKGNESTTDGDSLFGTRGSSTHSTDAEQSDSGFVSTEFVQEEPVYMNTVGFKGGVKPSFGDNNIYSHLSPKVVENGFGSTEPSAIIKPIVFEPIHVTVKDIIPPK